MVTIEDNASSSSGLRLGTETVPASIDCVDADGAEQLSSVRVEHCIAVS